jgi:uncharacterized protein
MAAFVGWPPLLLFALPLRYRPLMKILVSGSTGLVGSAIIPALTQQGDQIYRLVRRRTSAPNEVFWDPPRGAMDARQMEGFDAVIHLAGESIASGRWTDARKKEIRDSRVNGTRLLANTLLRLTTPPKILISASAIGYYGDRGSEMLPENAPAGTGFLAETCQAWEAAAQPARDNGIRVVNLRFGIILSKQGGALAKMLLPFRMGAGGKIGSGEQYMSWITIGDVVGAVLYALKTDSLRGPVNTVSPGAVTNAEFTKALGHALSRPTLLPMPAFGARLAFGEMADALLLASQRVEPAVLKQNSFAFQSQTIDQALQSVLV